MAISKHMTINNFLQNPTGAYSASFARRDLIIQGMKWRYQELIKKHGNLQMIHVWEQNDNVYFHFKVPSEKFGKKCMYDVVIKFVCSNPTLMKSSTTLNGYGINVFSNSPNFMFTYAYVYNQDGILIPESKTKLPEKCLTDKPEIKNPNESYGFEKSVYFAMLYIMQNGYNVKAKAKARYNPKMDIEKCLIPIDTAENKLMDYNREKKQEQLAKKAKKQSEKRKAEVEKKKLQNKKPNKQNSKKRKTP